MEIRAIMGDVCWICGNLEPDVCHVFTQADRQLGLWQEKSLINFDVRSPENGIALCPTCHTQFDRTEDPGFVFFPPNLDFFIDFELQDRRRRSNSPDTARIVPTIDQVRADQVAKQLIPMDSTGCLYKVVILKHLWGPNLNISTAPRLWHGAPIPTLRRAMLVLGGGRSARFDPTSLQQLTQLRDLYFGDDDVARENENVDPNKSDMISHKRNIGNDTNEVGIPKRQRTQNRESLTDTTDSWVLGPANTATDAINRYGWMFH